MLIDKHKNNEKYQQIANNLKTRNNPSKENHKKVNIIVYNLTKKDVNRKRKRPLKKMPHHQNNCKLIDLSQL